MFKYIRYQYSNMARKASTYAITLITFLLILVPILVIQKGIAHGSGISSTNLFLQSMIFISLPFLGLTMFIATKVIDIFKDGELDGTELMIVSKPLTRKQIIFGKFLTLYSVLFIFAIVMFIGAGLASAADTEATAQTKLKFAASIAFGGLIISFALASIIVLIATIMGRVATIALAIIFAAVMPTVSSTALVKFGKGNLTAADSKHVTFTPDKQNLFISGIDGKSGTVTAKRLYYADPYAKKAIEAVNKGWYKKSTLLEPWYHYTRLYTMFSTGLATNDTTTNWITKTQKVDTKFKVLTQLGTGTQATYKKLAVLPTVAMQKFVGTINNNYSHKGVAPMTNAKLPTVDKHGKKIASTIAVKDINNKAIDVPSTNVFSAIKALLWATSLKKPTDVFSLEEKAYYVQKMLYQFKQEGYIDENFTGYNDPNTSLMPEVKLATLWIIANSTEAEQKNLRLSLATYYQNNFKVNNGIKIISADSTDVVMQAEPKHFQPLWLIILIWLIIAVGLNGFVLYKFLNRDFK